MPDSDIDLIVSVVDGILSDITKQPQLKPCVLPDGWIPIASLLNYTHLGRSVWPFGGVGVVADCLAARNSSVSELSGDNSCVRNKPLRVRLRHSLEFIFSDSNYHKDVHLQLLQEAGLLRCTALTVRTPQLFGAGRGAELKHYFSVPGVGLSWVAASGSG